MSVEFDQVTEANMRELADKYRGTVAMGSAQAELHVSTFVCVPGDWIGIVGFEPLRLSAVQHDVLFFEPEPKPKATKAAATKEN